MPDKHWVCVERSGAMDAITTRVKFEFPYVPNGPFRLWGDYYDDGPENYFARWRRGLKKIAYRKVNAIMCKVANAG